MSSESAGIHREYNRGTDRRPVSSRYQIVTADPSFETIMRRPGFQRQTEPAFPGGSDTADFGPERGGPPDARRPEAAMVTGHRTIPEAPGKDTACPFRGAAGGWGEGLGSHTTDLVEAVPALPVDQLPPAEGPHSCPKTLLAGPFDPAVAPRVVHTFATLSYLFSIPCGPQSGRPAEPGIVPPRQPNATRLGAHDPSSHTEPTRGPRRTGTRSVLRSGLTVIAIDATSGFPPELVRPKLEGRGPRFARFSAWI